jgi:hypothetical protein
MRSGSGTTRRSVGTPAREESKARREARADAASRGFNIDARGDRSGAVTSVIRFSCLVVLFLLPPIAFAQAHLLKHRPFQLADPVQSGGDHICDLRRDTDGDGKPERLGDYVRIRGTVIAGPSTYETGGWLFWLREGPCGILVYGEPEVLALGDSVEAAGWLRRTNGNYFFPETGLATLGDLAVENAGVGRVGHSRDTAPLAIAVEEFRHRPEAYGGNLVALAGLRPVFAAQDENGDTFVRMASDGDSILAYIDGDTGVPAVLGIGSPGEACYDVTGIAVRMRAPAALGPSPQWCIAPRDAGDVGTTECSSGAAAARWGAIKALYGSGE